MDDPYEVLGLKHGATTAQIKARYRQLVFPGRCRSSRP